MITKKKLTRHLSLKELLLIFVLFASNNCTLFVTKKYDNPKLAEVEKAAILSRDSALLILDTILPEKCSANDRIYFDFYKSILQCKFHISNDSIDYFRSKFVANNDNYSIGLTYYIEAHSKSKLSVTTMEKVNLLKKTEYYWLKVVDISKYLMGKLYIKIGYELYTDYMYEEAAAYYEKGLEILLSIENKKDKDFIYLTQAYESLIHIYGVSEKNDDSIINDYYDKALFYSRKLKDSVFVYENQIIYNLIVPEQKDSNLCLNIAKKSCNTTRTTHWAHWVTEYYMEHNQWDSALVYLNKFAVDTLHMTWSKNEYKELLARYKFHMGDVTEAYRILGSIYSEQKEKTEKGGFSRSYAIARQYDDIMTREEKLIQQEKQQKTKTALAVIIIISLLLLLILTIFIFMYRKKKMEKQLEQERYKAETNLLQAQLDTALATLREKLRQRLIFTKQLRMSQFKGQTIEQMPEWAKQIIISSAFVEKQKWKEFRDEYNESTHGQLDKLKQQYPALTEADLQYIALSTLGLTVEEMCILLNCTNRTIWNRKQTVQNKLQ